MRVWDVSDRSPQQSFDLDARTVLGLAFSPDGSTLATSDSDGQSLLFDLDPDPGSGEADGRALVGHAGNPLSASFSPDGATLATAGSDGRVILWDVVGAQQIGTALPGPEGVPGVATFSPDGRSLAAVYLDGTAMLWAVEPEAWESHACAVAARNLTRAEWFELFGDEEYRVTCAGWPPGV